MTALCQQEMKCEKEFKINEDRVTTLCQERLALGLWLLAESVRITALWKMDWFTCEETAEYNCHY